MTKAELVAVVSYKTGQTKIATEKTVDALLEVIADTLVNGDTVKLVDFGKLYTKRKEAFKMDNHLIGSEITVPARMSVKFAPSKLLKDRLSKAI